MSISSAHVRVISFSSTMITSALTLNVPDLLRRKLVAKSDPDELSVLIAMDCLKKLPQRLPEYQRVLDVIISVIESGLYLNNSVDTILPASQDPSREDDDLPRERKLLYFEAFWALNNIANAEQAPQPNSGRASLKNYPWQDKSNELSFRQRIETLINQLDADEDKKELFELLLRGNMNILAGLACEEVLKHYLGAEIAESADTLFSLLMQHVNPSKLRACWLQ